MRSPWNLPRQPVLGPHSHIQQQRLGGPVPELPKIAALMVDGDKGVDEENSKDAGAGNTI